MCVILVTPLGSGSHRSSLGGGVGEGGREMERGEDRAGKGTMKRGRKKGKREWEER